MSGGNGTVTLSFRTDPILAVAERGRVVAIVGTANSSRNLANLEPEGVEVWALSDSYTFLKRASRWFETHDMTGAPDAAEWQAKMRDLDVPVFTMYPLPDVPNSRELPYQAIAESLGVEPYFTSTVAYMLAMAIYERVAEIRLFGVDMASGTEYEDQRPCCEYWIGIARARGIKVIIPSTSPLCKGPLYGIQFKDAVSRNMLMDKLAELRRQERDSGAQFYGVRGGIEVIRQLLEELHMHNILYVTELAGENIPGSKAVSSL